MEKLQKYWSLLKLQVSISRSLCHNIEISEYFGIFAMSKPNTRSDQYFHGIGSLLRK